MTPHTAGISDWLSDQSDDILRRIAAGTVNAMNWMMLKALDFVNGGSKINLGTQWLQDMLTMMRYLMIPVVGVLFVLQVATAILSKSPSDLWRAVWGSVLGILVGAAGAFLVASVLSLSTNSPTMCWATRRCRRNWRCSGPSRWTVQSTPQVG